MVEGQEKSLPSFKRNILFMISEAKYIQYLRSYANSKERELKEVEERSRKEIKRLRKKLRIIKDRNKYYD